MRVDDVSHQLNSAGMADPSVADCRFEVRTTSESHFGRVGTRLSLERTMVSWLRTATARIGFGHRAILRVRENHPKRAPAI